ncbi:MAG: U32 family peptidase [Clostridia bacterium]|nr:U32 family peptidase [Clostridia bacterium]
MTTKLPELLAPAGSMEALDAAILAGADAVYIGGRQFNARMNAKNFDRPQIVEAVKKCHENGVKLYVTLNTLTLDREMNEALSYAAFLYEAGVDALIVADLGLSLEIRARMPDFPLHASTQMSGHNLAAAEFLSGVGFKRMVCAREASKRDLQTLCASSPVEIEVFVHGALCVSVSGQCLFSSVVGGRSGNRGECAQPCRLPYNGKYPLSLKDNCLASHLRDLIAMGVASLKIEGRMKSPDYVYRVVSVYRRLLDEARDAGEKELRALAAAFSRQGFTDGYYTGRITPAMLGTRTEEDKKLSAAPCRMDRVARSFAPLVLARPALPAPPPFVTRRAPAPPKKARSARFYKASSIPENAALLDVVYLPLDRFEKGRANGVVFPPVIFDSELPAVREKLKKAKACGAVHALVCNIGQIALARELGFVMHGDYRLNIFNSASAAFFEGIFADVLLSPELLLAQARDIGGEKSFIVYGRLPLMTLEKPVGADSLRDRRGVVFPVLRECGRDIVFNSLPTYMGDRKQLLKAAGIENEHYIFTVEGPNECRTVLDYYQKGLPTKKEVRRIR